MAAKYRDRLFTIAEQYKAGEITEQDCRDQIEDVLDDIEEAALAAKD